MMPIKLSIVRELPEAKHSGNTKNNTPSASQYSNGRRAGPMRTAARGRPVSLRSINVRAFQAGRSAERSGSAPTADGNDGGNLGNRHVPYIGQQRRLGADAERTRKVGNRQVDGNCERLDQADQQRGDERSGQRT